MNLLYTPANSQLPAFPPAEAIFEISELGSFLDTWSHRKAAILHHTCFLILWLKETTSNKIHCMYATRPIDPGLFPDRPVHSANTQGYALLFSREFLCTFTSNDAPLLQSGLFSTSGVTTLTTGKGKEWEALVNNMIKEYTRAANFQKEMLVSMLKVFLMHLIRTQRTTGNNPASGNPSIPVSHLAMDGDRHLADRFLHLVDKHFLVMKKVSDYAALLDVGPSYLNVVIKKATGLTASHHISQRVILEAKEQARIGIKNLSEIATMLGFCDNAHFSKFFKKHTATSYTEFKRS